MGEKSAPKKTPEQENSQKKGQETPKWIGYVLAIIIIIGIGIAAKTMIFSDVSDETELDPTIVIVNTERLHQSYINKKYNELGPELQKVIAYDEFIDQLIDQRILVQETKRLKINISSKRVLKEFDQILEQEEKTRSELRAELELRNLTEEDVLTTLKHNMMIEEMIQKVILPKVSVTQDEIKELYELNKKTFDVKETVHASHILVNSKEKAQELIKLLGQGSDFVELALEHSEDPTVKDNLGNLGFFEREIMVKEFADVAFVTKPGSIAGPVKTEFGWHVMVVHDKKGSGFLDIEDVSQILEDSLTEEKFKKGTQELIEFLKEKSQIEWVKKEE